MAKIKSKNKDNTEKPRKSDKHTVNQRVSVIVELKTKGYSRKDILEYVEENENWGVSETMIDNYIKKANDFFAANSKVDRNRAIAQSRARYEFILKQALKIFDLSAAARAQKEIDLLDGLKAPKQLEIAPQKIIVGLRKPKPE